MALISKASLLMVPSTYEEGTLYNVLPSGNRAPDSTDQNSGYDQTRADFDFDRGSNAAATRIGSDGLIKKYRENLLTESNNFSDSDWDEQNATLTSGQVDKDGGTDAWKFEATTTGQTYIQQSISIAANQPTALSIYAKKGNVDFLKFIFACSGSNSIVTFDLSDGSTSNNLRNISVNTEDVGGGWFRCSASAAPGTNITAERFEVRSDKSDADADDGSFIYIQNAQVETGLVATDYLDSGATTAKAGVLIDLPRINFDANGENGSLLLEPSRQQLLQYSEYFDGSGWNKTSGGTGSTPTTTINTNETLSPEGVYNATKIVFDSGSGTTTGDLSLIEGVVSIAAGTDASTSIWLKGENGGEQLHMRGVSNGSFSIITLTTEWQQFTTSENSSTTTDSLQFGIRQNVSGLGIINSNATIYAYGAQIELGSYATSYIPNHGTSSGVTRAADRPQILNTTTDILSQTAFTLFFEADLTLDTTNNFMDIVAFRGSSSALRIETRTDSSVRVQQSEMITSGDSWNSATIGDTDNKKFAITFTTSQVRLYADGSLVNTYNGAYSSDLVNILFRNSTSLGVEIKTNFKQYILFNEALTDAECVTLTTL